jgi:hypothetical protein
MYWTNFNALGFFKCRLDLRILLKCLPDCFLDAVTNCSDGGVIGMVPGAIGCLQVSYFLFFILCDDESQMGLGSSLVNHYVQVLLYILLQPPQCARIKHWQSLTFLIWIRIQVR